MDDPPRKLDDAILQAIDAILKEFDPSRQAGDPSRQPVEATRQPPAPTRKSDDPIRRLFASPALYRTMAVFFDYPGSPIHPRLISRCTRTDIKSVLRQLAILREIGMLRSRRVGKERRYRLVEECELHEEFRALFAKTRKYRRYRFPRPLL